MMIRETKKRTFANGHRIKCGDRSLVDGSEGCQRIDEISMGEGQLRPPGSAAIAEQLFLSGASVAGRQ